jgi:hypothetical protein
VRDHLLYLSFKISIEERHQISAGLTAGHGHGLSGDFQQFIAPIQSVGFRIFRRGYLVDEARFEGLLWQNQNASYGKPFGATRAHLTAQGSQDYRRQGNSNLYFVQADFEISLGGDSPIAKQSKNSSTGGCVTGDSGDNWNGRTGEGFQKSIEFTPDRGNGRVIKGYEEGDIETGRKTVRRSGKNQRAHAFLRGSRNGLPKRDHEFGGKRIDRRAVQLQFANWAVIGGEEHSSCIRLSRRTVTSEDARPPFHKSSYFLGIDWKMANTAPCGSARTAKRPTFSMVIGSR